ncbi:MAG TPA: hypothetical protein VJ852_14440, partial [Gemmatimonadaceae bacterium]|nr:hypothetical protein [Gemmatimonadaceae bacterium]
MPYPHHNSMSNPSTYVVRPGSSAALTARTIDATQRPVLTRASESVSQAVPQLTDSFRNAFTSPVFLSGLALSLIAIWVLSRMRRQLSGLALGAMLVVALTSFTAPRKPTPKRVVDLTHTPRTTRNRMQSASWNGYGYIAPRPQEDTGPVGYGDSDPVVVTPTTPMYPDPVDIVLPATPIPPMPEWRDEVMRNVQR